MGIAQLKKLQEVLIKQLLDEKPQIEDLDLEQWECVVYDKGDKEQTIYFDAKVKIHLKDYIQSRTDDNPTLFVTLDAQHKFRGTMATRAIDKGMPIEQVQKNIGTFTNR